jgi:hypothetical protein
MRVIFYCFGVVSKIGCSEMESPYRTCSAFLKLDPCYLRYQAGLVAITTPAQGTAPPLQCGKEKSP